MASSSTSTLFVNQTGDVVKVKVGNRKSSSPIASITGAGGQFRMHVNMNDTYREFVVDSEAGNSKTAAIVTSDDCCDYQCITIKEVLADGTLHLLREPRQHTSGTANSKLDHMNTPAAKKPSWFTWKMWV